MEEVTADQIEDIIQQQTDATSKEVSQFVCSLSKPEKVGEGINAYVSYVVTIQKPDGSSTTFTRRYSDFDWLHDMLKLEYTSYIIPPLPEKVIFDRFTPENVEYRRKELERFLNRVMNHPAFYQSKLISLFMTASEAFMEGERLKPRVASPPPPTVKKEEGFFAAFSALTAAVSRPAVELKEIDPWFENQKIYLSNLEQHLQVLVERSNENTKKKQEMVTTLEDLAHASSLACGAEARNDDTLSEYWSKLAEILNQMSLLTKELVQGETESFEYQIKDYVRLTLASKDLMENRNVALLKLQTSQADAAVKNEKLQKAGSSSKANALAAEAKEANQEVDLANQEFTALSNSAKEELTKFKSNKATQFKTALRDLVTININHQLRVVNLWKELLVELGEEK